MLVRVSFGFEIFRDVSRTHVLLMELLSSRSERLPRNEWLRACNWLEVGLAGHLRRVLLLGVGLRMVMLLVILLRVHLHALVELGMHLLLLNRVVRLLVLVLLMLVASAVTSHIVTRHVVIMLLVIVLVMVIRRLVSSILLPMLRLVRRGLDRLRRHCWSESLDVGRWLTPWFEYLRIQAQLLRWSLLRLLRHFLEESFCLQRVALDLIQKVVIDLLQRFSWFHLFVEPGE